MNKTPWVVEFYPDDSSHKQAACFESEDAARDCWKAVTKQEGKRIFVKDDRGFEIALYPERFTIVLVPPQAVAEMQHAAANGPPLFGKSTH